MYVAFQTLGKACINVVPNKTLFSMVSVQQKELKKERKSFSLKEKVLFKVKCYRNACDAL